MLLGPVVLTYLILLSLPDQGRGDSAATGSVFARAPRARPGNRLPVLSYHGGDLLVRWIATNPYVHDVSLADLVNGRDTGTGSYQSGSKEATRLDEGP